MTSRSSKKSSSKHSLNRPSASSKKKSIARPGTYFDPKPSWTGPEPGMGLPASQRFKHWVCANNRCVPEQQDDFTESINWRIFRIMAEFVEGFEFLSQFHKEVTFFGSARAMPENKYYQMAKTLGAMCGKAGYTVITGGGPGIMEAGNWGAYDAGGESVGIDIILPLEQRRNSYVRKSKGFHYFFTRKVMLSASAQAYVFFPGGFGTLDELFEMVTLIQTGKMSDQIPVILVGKDYWQGALEWIKKTMMNENHFIEPFELEILQPVDTVEQAFRIIKKTHDRKL